MPHSAEIRLKDHTGSLVDVSVDWVDLQWSKRVNSPGWYRLTVSSESEFASLVRKDYQVELFREQGTVIPKYLEFEGVHRTPHRLRNVSGQGFFISYGRGYLDLITRTIAYPAGHARTSKDGPGETVIKQFVDENAGSNALASAGREADGIMTGLSIQGDGAAGTNWTGSRSQRNLIRTIQEIAVETNVDFALVGSGAALFRFDAGLHPLGLDRSVVGLDTTTGLNAAGNRPVIFSEEFANVESPEHIVKATDEMTVVYVLGQGVGSDRNVVVRTAAAATDTPWNRREMAREAAFLSTTAALNDLGDEELTENEAREEGRFDPIQEGPWRYGRDYFVGDIVTYRYPVEGGTDIEINRQIVAMVGTIDADDGEEIRLELATTP